MCWSAFTENAHVCWFLKRSKCFLFRSYSTSWQVFTSCCDITRLHVKTALYSYRAWSLSKVIFCILLTVNKYPGNAKTNNDLILLMSNVGVAQSYLIHLCRRPPLLSRIFFLNTLKTTTPLKWVTYSFITINMGPVVYFESIQHTPSPCCKCAPAQQIHHRKSATNTLFVWETFAKNCSAQLL